MNFRNLIIAGIFLFLPGGIMVAQEKRVYQTARLITEAPVIDGLPDDA
jgi:hypothetical protein